MNRFIPANGQAAFQPEGLLRSRSISSARVTAVENKPRGWTAIKTFLLLQIYLGLCRNTCLFTCIQVRNFSLTVYRAYISHLARLIWLLAFERDWICFPGWTPAVWNFCCS